MISAAEFRDVVRVKFALVCEEEVSTIVYTSTTCSTVYWVGFTNCCSEFLNSYCSACSVYNSLSVVAA
jgi:hypothetical protein